MAPSTRAASRSLLENILPALDGIDPTQPAEAVMHSAVEANVRHTLRELRALPETQPGLATAGMKLVGAVYDLESGRVRFLE